MRRAAAMSIGDSLRERPRQVDEPVQIGAHHAVLARGLGHALQTAQFLARLVLDLLRHMRVGDRLIELGDLGRLSFVGLAELALNRRHLLAQQDLAVAGVERSLGLPANLLRKPKHLDPMREQSRDALDSGADVHRLEDLLLLIGRSVHESRHQIGQATRRIDALNGRQQFVRRLRQELDRLDCLTLEMEETGLDFVRRWSRFRNPFRLGDEERPTSQIVVDPEALLSLADDMVRAVRRGDVANDIGDRPHSMQVDRKGIGDLGAALHHDADRLLLSHRPLRRKHGPRAPEGDRQHGPGKQHQPAHRHDDQGVRRQRGRRRRT